MTLVSLFEEQVRKTPDEVALVSDEMTLTFQELNTLANRLSEPLREHGVTAGSVVGLCMQRSAMAIATLLSILKSGAAYLPISTEAPAERRAFMLRDSQAILVVADDAQLVHFATTDVMVLSGKALAAAAQTAVDTRPAHPVTSSDVAWVLYTSGSTGQPKGVLGSHRACVVRLQAMWSHQPFIRGERCFLNTAFTTVDSFWEIFGPLCAGHALCVLNDDLLRDPSRLLPELATLKIRRICMVPSLLATWLEIYPSLSRVVPALQLWVVSGEALTVSLCERFRIAMPEAHLINQYGLTESCADITTFDTWGWTAPPDYGSHYVPVGKPFEGTSMVVVDAGQQPLPDGQAGELCIAGLSLCNGYLNRPDQEGQRFVSLNIEGENVRVLRTGDKVIRLASGDLIHLGRIDSQIKLRGYRIEPGEVENLLCDHPSVKQAAIVFDADQQRLVAFLAVREGTYDAEDALIDSLRRYAETTLLPYMRPTTYVLNDVLPITATGKINRQALRIPDENKPPLTAYVEPQQGIELDIAQAMAEVLGLQRIGATDNFLYLGGNSLQAMKVIALLRTRVTVDIVPSLFFPDPTPRAIARALADAGASRAETELRPVQHGRYCRASFTQERLWVLDRLGGGKAAYTIVWHLQMQGEVNIPALNAALNVIVARHDSLRTRFQERDGECLQEIMPAETLSLDVESLTTGECEQRLNQLANREFDLTRGPLYRFELLQSGDRNFSLAIALHHIVCDGWSVDVLARELCELYTARVEEREAILPELPVQFADFALWQRQMLDKPEAARRLAYWKNKLQGAPAGLELPTDRPRPAVASYRGAHVPVTLAPETVEALRALAQRQGVTLYMVLLAAFQVVLSRWSGQDDVVVGSPVAGRMLAETEPMIGFFANTLALRGDLSGNPSFETLLHRTRQTALEAYENQDVPFERIVEALQPVRDLSRQAIFQVMLALHPQFSDLQMPGISLRAEERLPESAKFDLALELTETRDGLSGQLEYALDLWDKESAEQIVQCLSTLLQSLPDTVECPLSQQPLLTAAGQYQLLTEWNNTAEDYPHDQCIASLFEAQAEQTPDALAVYFDGEEIDYRELDRRAEQVASRLVHAGIGPDCVVGLFVERSIEMISGLLGILKSGAAYLPLDTDYPPDRIAYMLEDAQVPVVLTQRRLLARLPETSACCMFIDDETSETALPPRKARNINAHHLAYVIYTSGSTGRPKGVMISHFSILNHLSWMQRTHRLTPDDRVLQNAPVSFDVSVWQLFWPLLNGAGLVVTSPEGHRDLSYLSSLIESSRVTVMHMVPSMLQALVDIVSPHTLRRVRDFIVGGEALPPSLLQDFSQRFDCRLHNQYGPTETSVEVSWHQCSADEDRLVVPIGAPLSNTRLYVLDRYFNLCPVGVPGELYIAGAGLARGYLNRPDITAERFLPDPFSDGQRMYRTGDLARWTARGVLEYLGRIDHQVKIRGFRVETGEIDTCLLAHPGIHQAIVVPWSSEQKPLQLVAYLVLKDPALQTAEVQVYLRRFLPEHMIPAAFVTLGALPLTPNSKVDRKALPPPTFVTRQRQAVPPRTSEEFALCEIWGLLLNCPEVGIEDDFFALGGHSLLAMRMVAMVRARLGVELPLREIFDAPVIVQLASRLAHYQAREEGSSPIGITPRDGNQPLRLSFSQERLWFLDRLVEAGVAYNVPWSLEMRGELQTAALEWAINQVICRHESLRTVFRNSNGTAVQTIVPAENESLVSQSVPEYALDNVLQTVAEYKFELQTGPLYRFRLYRLSAERHVLAFVAHHIICDGWSVDVLARELCELYTARVEEREAILPELPVQFADFALWQRQMLDKPEAARRLAYWKNKLQGAPAGLELPTDRPRPAVASYRGAHVPVTLAPETVEALRALAQRQGVTLYMVLLAAFQVVLSRWSGQDDVVVGSPVAGRMLAETEPMIGFFANTLALRGDLSGDPSFETLLHRTRQTALEAYENQDVPFERIVEVLQPVRDLSRQAIFQVMFGLYSPDHQLQMTGLELEGREGRTHSAKIDLNLELTETANEVSGHIEYLTGLWDEETMLRFSSHLLNVLRDVAVDSTRRLSGVDMLGEQQRYQLLTSFNATRAGYPTGYLLHHLFERNAQENPQRLALVFRQQSYTYGELNRRANRLANHLIHSGIGPDDRVALLLERPPAMLVALLGVLKAGAAYVPLDTGYPEERVEYMLRHCQPKLLLGGEDDVAPYGSTGIPCLVLDDEGHSPLVSGVSDCDPEPVLVGLTPENLAYIIYTSGSTGRPKGVMLPHGAVINFLYAMRDRLGFTANDGMLAVTTPSFDIAVLELYLPLITGGRIVLTSRKEMRDGAALARLVAHRDVTFMQATPSTWRMMLEAGWQGSPQLTALCGGEALDRELCNRLVCATRRFWNMYGPTETTVWSTCQRIEDVDTPISIGTPVAETTVRILNGQGLLQPVGVAGELYIGGAGLARGYLWQPELTAERFIPDRYSEEPGMRLYRTGDLARWRRDGTIEYLGRNDHQVKLRGFRIELGEIEACLQAHPAVRECIVMVREDRTGEKRLVAYIVANADLGTSPVAVLRAHASQTLPEFMVPTAIVTLPAFPLTPNGKVDRNAMPEPDLTSLATREYAAPKGHVEMALAEIWQQLLGVSRVGRTDHFFELGGHSLLALRLIEGINATLGVEFALRDLFANPVLSQMAKQLTAQDKKDVATSDRPNLVHLRRGRSPVKLVCIHPGGGGGIGEAYAPLIGALSKEMDVTGISAVDLDTLTRPEASVPEIAANYLHQLSDIIQTPWILVGWSAGGLIAYEMTRLAMKNGCIPLGTLLIDSYPHTRDTMPDEREVRVEFYEFLQRIGWLTPQTGGGNNDALSSTESALFEAILGRMQSSGEERVNITRNELEYIYQVFSTLQEAYYKYQIPDYDGNIDLFIARDSDTDPGEFWANRVRAGLTITPVNGTHYSMLFQENVTPIALRIQQLCVNYDALTQFDESF
ncbi:non-ribosomal peptide synthetase [Salmonella enterica subsp. arizonae]|nr:non-ribosomal peptide synthetase [Salmonella enterica subsp. arizonae]